MFPGLNPSGVAAAAGGCDPTGAMRHSWTALVVAAAALACLPRAAGGEEQRAASAALGRACGVSRRSSESEKMRPAPPADVKGADHVAGDKAHHRWAKDAAYGRWLHEQRACRADPSRSRNLLNALDAKRQAYFATPGATREGDATAATDGPVDACQSEGNGSSQPGSVLNTLLEIRRRFQARRLQAGLNPQHEDAAITAQEDETARQNGTSPGEAASEERREALIAAAKRRRAEAAAASAAAQSPAVLPAPAASPKEKQRAGGVVGDPDWECVVCGEELRDRVVGAQLHAEYLVSSSVRVCCVVCVRACVRVRACAFCCMWRGGGGMRKRMHTCNHTNKHVRRGCPQRSTYHTHARDMGACTIRLAHRPRGLQQLASLLFRVHPSLGPGH